MIVQAKSRLDKIPGPKLMLYRVNAGDIPADSWIQRDEGGGRIVGEVCHFIDTLIHLIGSLPVEVQAVALKDRGDAVSTIIRFADGSTGTVLYSSVGDPNVPKEYLEVFAAGTVVQMEDFTSLIITENGKRTVQSGKQDKGQKALVRAFLNSVLTDGPAQIPLKELIAVTETTFAIELALQSGGPVELGA